MVPVRKCICCHEKFQGWGEKDDSFVALRTASAWVICIKCIEKCPILCACLEKEDFCQCCRLPWFGKNNIQDVIRKREGYYCRDCLLFCEHSCTRSTFHTFEFEYKGNDYSRQ